MVSDQVQHKLRCTITEVGYRLENSDVEGKAIVKTITVTAKLICGFGLAYADCWFSLEAAYFSENRWLVWARPISCKILILGVFETTKTRSVAPLRRLLSVFNCRCRECAFVQCIRCINNHIAAVQTMSVLV